MATQFLPQSVCCIVHSIIGLCLTHETGQCGPLLGTNVFPSSEKPYYRKGMWISAAFCLFVAVLSCVLSLWLIYENKKLDKAQANAERREEKGEHVSGPSAEALANYRYVW